MPKLLEGNFLMEQKNEQWLVSAEELLAMPPQPMTLDAVLDAAISYSPEFIHGLPKRRYIRFLERVIEQQKANPCLAGSVAFMARDCRDVSRELDTTGRKQDGN